MKAISIHLTDRCNNSCKFCVVNSHKEKKEGVNKKIIYNFLKENQNKGYECVNIHGGEPTMEESFLEVLGYIKECGYPHVSLQTNARLAADFDYVKKMVDVGVDLFVVSVHSVNEESSAWITGDEECMAQTLQGIRNIKSLGIKVRTNTVVCKQNLEELSEIFEYVVEELKVDHVNISAIHPTGKAYENFQFVVPKLSEIIPKVTAGIDYMDSKGTVVTLEGFPRCMLGVYEDRLIDWEENQYKLLYHHYILENYDQFMRNQTRHLSSECGICCKKDQCGGLYKEYIEFYGSEEVRKII